MAQVEFTQTFTLACPLVGENLALSVSLNSGAMGVYVVKSLTCYSTTGFNNTIPAYSIQMIQSAHLLWSDISAAATGVIDVLFSPDRQIYLSNPTLTFNANVTAAGSVILVVSYLFIPVANVLSENFMIADGIITNSSASILTGSLPTQATIVRSVIAVNTHATDSATISLLLNSVRIDAPTVIAAGVTYHYTLPIYINSTQILSMSSAGAGVAVHYTVSHIEDPAA